MKKTMPDHIVSFVKAGFSGLPGIGGPIASLIGDYIPTSTERIFEESLQSLKARLESLQDRIDARAVNKEEFAELFKWYYLLIIRTHQKEKLKAATSLISNIFLKEGDPDKLSYTELDHFVRCLESLSVGAIHVLGTLVKIMRESRGQALENHPYSVGFNTLREKLPELGPSLLMGLIGELNSMNLLHVPGAPTIRTPGFGNYEVELTAIGTRFVDRLLDI